MAICKCLTCGCEFNSRVTGKYCSRKCRAIRGRKEAVCIACGAQYFPSSVSQKYCDASCALRHSKPVRQITCCDCGVVFTHLGRGWRKRCGSCQRIDARVRSYRNQLKTNKIKTPGVGKGGNQWGARNHQWVGGVRRNYKGNYRLRCFRLWGSVCVVCGSGESVQAHHVNGNVSDFSEGNLIPLCHDHHWKIHSSKRLTAEQLYDRLEQLWPNCRLKIAEKIGELQKWTIRGEGESQPQRLEGEIIPPRGRDTQDFVLGEKIV